MPVIDSQHARELAARSHEARKRNKELREQAEAQEEQRSHFTPQIAQEHLTIDVSCVRARLEKLDKLMAKAEDDKQWDAYSRAYERMFRVWCTLTKTPGPGNLKPTAPRQQRATVVPQAVPEPVPYGLKLMPSGSEATTGSVPQGQPTPATPQDSQMP